MQSHLTGNVPPGGLRLLFELVFVPANLKHRSGSTFAREVTDAATSVTATCVVLDEGQ